MSNYLSNYRRFCDLSKRILNICNELESKINAAKDPEWKNKAQFCVNAAKNKIYETKRQSTEDGLSQDNSILAEHFELLIFLLKKNVD